MSTRLAPTDWRRAFGAAVQTAKTAARLLDEVMREQAAERAISYFWEAEADRRRRQPVPGSREAYALEMADLWEQWDGSVGDPPPQQRSWVNEPPIVWWHAHRRTTR